MFLLTFLDSIVEEPVDNPKDTPELYTHSVDVILDTIKVEPVNNSNDASRLHSHSIDADFLETNKEVKEKTKKKAVKRSNEDKNVNCRYSLRNKKKII